MDVPLSLPSHLSLSSWQEMMHCQADIPQLMQLSQFSAYFIYVTDHYLWSYMQLQTAPALKLVDCGCAHAHYAKICT